MIPIPRCRLVVAPGDGHLLTALAERTEVRAGDVVATVGTSRGRLELVAPQAGRVGGALVDTTHAVAEGDGVLWLDVA